MKSYKLNGQYVSEKPSEETARLVSVINEEHYETPEYSKQQNINAMKYFDKLREDREELNKRHGGMK